MSWCWEKIFLLCISVHRRKKKPKTKQHTVSMAHWFYFPSGQFYPLWHFSSEPIYRMMKVRLASCPLTSVCCVCHTRESFRALLRSALISLIWSVHALPAPSHCFVSCTVAYLGIITVRILLYIPVRLTQTLPLAPTGVFMLLNVQFEGNKKDFLNNPGQVRNGSVWAAIVLSSEFEVK